MFDDITRFQQLSLEDKENLFNRVFYANPVALGITSFETGRFIEVNASFINLFGYSREELIGNTVTALNIWQTPDGHEKLVQKLETQSEVRGLELSFRTKSGELRDFEASFELITLNGEECILSIGYDITDRKRAEEETRRALAKEKELSELKTRFVSLTSHEFRTPLSAILSSAELLEYYSDKLSEDKKAEYFLRIKLAVEHMTALLGDILFIDKVEAGKVEFMPARLDLVTLCRELVMGVEKGVGIQHNIKFVSQEKDIIGWIDTKLFGQIMNNLLSNAVKYSPTGSDVTVELRREGDDACIIVEDQGIGIPPEAQARLYEMFHRAENVNSIPGSGLGLAIVKRAVDIHGGKISGISQVGKGTTFTVTLPLTNRSDRK